MKTKFEFMKLCGVALLWVGLASLVYIPTASESITSTVVASLGFISFAAGALMLVNSIKGEIIEKINTKQDES